MDEREERGGVLSRFLKTERRQAGEKESTPWVMFGRSRDQDGRVDLDELAREGARRMIAVALEAEVDDYVQRFAAELDEQGHRLVVR